jgi:hypothetical protein
VPGDDFDGVARAGVPDVGAYALAGDGPDWAIGEGFKDPTSAPMPGVDAGVGEPDAGPGVGDASVPSADAGPRGDAGSGGDGGGVTDEGDGGCGCRVMHAGARDLVPFCAMLVLAWRRRR